MEGTRAIGSAGPPTQIQDASATTRNPLRQLAVRLPDSRQIRGEDGLNAHEVGLTDVASCRTAVVAVRTTWRYFPCCWGGSSGKWGGASTRAATTGMTQRHRYKSGSTRC
jgi:hypothetical protein